VTKRQYDAAGRRVWEQNPLGGVSKFEYDNAGRLTLEMFEPLPGDSLETRITEYVYDAVGRLRQTIQRGPDPQSPNDDLVTSVDYFLPERNGQPAQNGIGDVVTIDAWGNATSLAHDSLGNVFAVRGPDADGDAMTVDAPITLTTYTYDSMAGVVAVTKLWHFTSRATAQFAECGGDQIPLP